MPKKSEFIKLMEKGEIDDSYNMRGDNVASSRSRLEKDKTVPKLKAGARHQNDFLNLIKKMFNTSNAQIEVEPNVNTIDNIINKKDKKKLN